MKLARQNKDGGLYAHLWSGWRLSFGHHVIELTWTRPNLKHPAWQGKRGAS
jgi:hypothetical protein